MNEEIRGKIDKAFSFDEPKPKPNQPELTLQKPIQEKPIEQKPIEEKPEQSKPMKPRPKPKEDDSTDKYIALLQKGLIGKDEFVVLMGINKDKNHSIIYQ